MPQTKYRSRLVAGRSSLALGLLTFLTPLLVSLAAPEPADAIVRWKCTKGPWRAYTTRREMRGTTRFECGWGECGDLSHTQPESWVDIVGGLSQTCEDKSDSFRGPYGQWQGCVTWSGSQVATGRYRIEGIAEYQPFWPESWYNIGFLASVLDIRSSIESRVDDVSGAWASVYDLDYCFHVKIIGTIYYATFPVRATLKAGNPDASSGEDWAQFTLRGSTGLACSTKKSSCETVVCSDLQVEATLFCEYRDWKAGEVPEQR